MNKREYVVSAFEHKQTDKVPYYIRLTGNGYGAYGEKLLEDYASKDISDDLKEGIIDLSQAVDLAVGNFAVNLTFPWWVWDYDNFDPSYADPFNAPKVMPALLRNDSAEALEKYKKQAKYIAEKYQVYTVNLIYGNHWEKAYFTRGIENFLADIAGEPEFAQQLLDFIAELNMEILPRLMTPHLDGVLLGSDWGSQNDLIVSPDIWKSMMKQGQKTQLDYIKSKGKHTLIHSCGCILKILPELVEMGLDVLNPVQPECMDLRFLKETYGDKLSFWGGISTQKTLPYGTPEEVKKETEDVIKLMSENGGYLTCSSQEIQTDVSYENLIALIETAKSFT